MAPDILEIEPRELKFTFELKKQISCSVHLVNNTNSYVAFKVKTTSPKRYCVRPNTGVIMPRSTCDFTVTMQAQWVAPVDMQLKDKFLIQSTIVPYGTTDEDIVPSFLSKENGRYIEESKLRVVLVSPPHSPVLQPINGALKHEATEEAPDLKETPVLNSTESHQEENFPPSHNQVSKEFDDLKLKLNDAEMKLIEVEKTITRIREAKDVAIQERDKLQQEIVLLRGKCATSVRVPFLFVVFVALVALVLGYQLHP